MTFFPGLMMMILISKTEKALPDGGMEVASQQERI